MIYYVSPNGSDCALGTAEQPFKTINRAAKVAVAGDTVRVHGGTYREWVSPEYGGTDEHKRIVYEAVMGECPVIKGSEIVTDWEKVKGTVWKKSLKNEIFGDFNPFAREVWGDWLTQPTDYKVHLGDVYINGVSMFEAKSFDDLYSDEKRLFCCQHDYRAAEEPILHPELTVYKWYAEVDSETTTIYCNFQDFDPNREVIEINVRPCCFYPKKTGVNYITLRGFEIAQAACPWIPPTADQIGMVGPHWSKGWIIEENRMHDAKCSAISLGKDASSGDMLGSKFNRKTPHRHQLEAVFIAANNGWSKETVGSHIVRNNYIYDCGQNGIAGHMGCIFSTVSHNHIYNIGIKHEFFGFEIGGIKLHAAIDVLIENNMLHNCTLGIWLDWQNQGCRVTKNIMYENNRDCMIEVTHGPCVVDHNILMSDFSLDYCSQGNAIVHNIICGALRFAPVPDRETPYHFPHSTSILGYCEVYGGDDRIYNNIFTGGCRIDEKSLVEFTEFCDIYSDPDEYTGYEMPQPIWIKDNAYSGRAKPSKYEKHPIYTDAFKIEIEQKNREWVLHIDVPSEVADTVCDAVTTARLGETRLSQMAFEAPDGSDIDFTTDIIGQRRSDRVVAGCFAEFKSGRQEITVWKE